MIIKFTIPLTKDLIVSEANRSNENRHIKKKRHQTQEFLINAFYNKHVDMREVLLPCLVKMTRIAPREFDFDNLVSSFKYIRDYISERILPGLAKGRADGDKRIEWVYNQEKGKTREYAIRIEIYTNVVQLSQVEFPIQRYVYPEHHL